MPKIWIKKSRKNLILEYPEYYKLIIESNIDDYLLYHKDAEKYDRFEEKTKQKEDTKIRYIINKIDTATNIDRNNKTAVKKEFYQPLMNRRAISINNYEDAKIINKFINNLNN